MSVRARSLVAWAGGIAMLALLLRLGFWQLERAEYKDALRSRFEANVSAPPASPATLLSLPDGEAAWRFRPAVFTGRPDVDRQYLLDNRTDHGRAGYHVLTVVRDAGVALLVDRGWLPVGPDRAVTPVLPLDEGVATFRGLLVPPPRPGLLLGDSGYDGGTWPRVVQQVDLGRIAAQTGAPLLPAMLLLDPQNPACLGCEWTPVAGVGAERHRGYALQWFSLAAALVVIAVVVTARRGRRRDGV